MEGLHDIQKSIVSQRVQKSFEKGRKGETVGTIKEWKGKKYQKQANGKWTEVIEKKEKSGVPSKPVGKLTQQESQVKGTKYYKDEDKNTWMDQDGKGLKFIGTESGNYKGITSGVSRGDILSGIREWGSKKVISNLSVEQLNKVADALIKYNGGYANGSSVSVAVMHSGVLDEGKEKTEKKPKASEVRAGKMVDRYVSEMKLTSEQREELYEAVLDDYSESGGLNQLSMQDIDEIASASGIESKRNK